MFYAWNPLGTSVLFRHQKKTNCFGVGMRARAVKLLAVLAAGSFASGARADDALDAVCGQNPGAWTIVSPPALFALHRSGKLNVEKSSAWTFSFPDLGSGWAQLEVQSGNTTRLVACGEVKSGVVYAPPPEALSKGDLVVVRLVGLPSEKEKPRIKKLREERQKQLVPELEAAEREHVRRHLQLNEVQAQLSSWIFHPAVDPKDKVGIKSLQDSFEAAGAAVRKALVAAVTVHRTGLVEEEPGTT